MDTDTASVVSDPGHHSHAEGERTLVHGGPRELHLEGQHEKWPEH